MAVRNRLTLLLLGMLALGLPAEAQAGRDLGTVLAEINQGFVCPEFQPDDTARRADLLSFSRALASVGPKRITYRQAAYIRSRMLLRHNCSLNANSLSAVTPAAEVVAAAVIK